MAHIPNTLRRLGCLQDQLEVAAPAGLEPGLWYEGLTSYQYNFEVYLRHMIKNIYTYMIYTYIYILYLYDMYKYIYIYIYCVYVYIYTYCSYTRNIDPQKRKLGPYNKPNTPTVAVLDHHLSLSLVSLKSCSTVEARKLQYDCPPSPKPREQGKLA